jgi:hypothetical protein
MRLGITYCKLGSRYPYWYRYRDILRDALNVEILSVQNGYRGMVDNFKYGNFENFKTPNRSLSWELSSPLPAYSYCRSVIRPTGWGCDDVRGCYDPVLVVLNCWELV